MAAIVSATIAALGSAQFDEPLLPVTATEGMAPGDVQLITRLRLSPGTRPANWTVIPAPGSGLPGADRSDGDLVHLVFCTDARHFPGLAGAIRSAAAACARPQRLVHHVIVPRGEEALAANFLACRNVSAPAYALEIVPFDDAAVQDLIRVERNSRQDLTASLNYARFFLPTLLPRVRRAFYADADTLVQGDVAALMDTVGDDFYLYAVPKDQTYARQYHRPVTYRTFKERYGFAIEPQDHTFNAGVALYHVAAMEAHNITREALWWMGRHKRNMYGLWRYGSQPLLHMAAYGRWRALPAAWNHHGLGYNQSMTAEELATGKVLHWTGTGKPFVRTGNYKYLWEPHSGLPVCGGRGRCDLNALSPAKACVPEPPSAWVA